MLRRRRAEHTEPDLAARERLERPESDMTPEDRRSLAFGRATAAKLLADPEAVMGKARRQLGRMQKDSDGSDRPYLDEWTQILDEGPEAAAAMLVSTSQRASDLRSCSPFAGVLTEKERWTIIRATSARGPGHPL